MTTRKQPNPILLVGLNAYWVYTDPKGVDTLMTAPATEGRPNYAWVTPALFNRKNEERLANIMFALQTVKKGL